MTALYIDTTPKFSEVALVGATTAILQAAQGTENRDLAGLVRRLLTENDVAASDLAAVVVNIGPGALSSVRVGVAFSNALAFGRGIETRGYASLDVMGFAALEGGASECAVSVVRGPEGALYVGRFTATDPPDHWVIAQNDLVDHEVFESLRNAVVAGPAAATLQSWCPFEFALSPVDHSSAARLIAIDSSDRRAAAQEAQAPIVGEDFR